MHLFRLFFIFFLFFVVVRAWDSEELEIFDLVEEVNKNFYDFMGLTQVGPL